MHIFPFQFPVGDKTILCFSCRLVKMEPFLRQHAHALVDSPSATIWQSLHSSHLRIALSQAKWVHSYRARYPQCKFACILDTKSNIKFWQCSLWVCHLMRMTSQLLCLQPCLPTWLQSCICYKEIYWSGYKLPSAVLPSNSIALLFSFLLLCVVWWNAFLLFDLLNRLSFSIVRLAVGASQRHLKSQHQAYLWTPSSQLRRFHLWMWLGWRRSCCNLSHAS